MVCSLLIGGDEEAEAEAWDLVHSAHCITAGTEVAIRGLIATAMEGPRAKAASQEMAQGLGGGAAVSVFDLSWSLRDLITALEALIVQQEGEEAEMGAKLMESARRDLLTSVTALCAHLELGSEVALALEISTHLRGASTWSRSWELGPAMESLLETQERLSQESSPDLAGRVGGLCGPLERLQNVFTKAEAWANRAASNPTTETAKEAQRANLSPSTEDTTLALDAAFNEAIGGLRLAGLVSESNRLAVLEEEYEEACTGWELYEASLDAEEIATEIAWKRGKFDKKARLVELITVVAQGLASASSALSLCGGDGGVPPSCCRGLGLANATGVELVCRGAVISRRVASRLRRAERRTISSLESRFKVDSGENAAARGGDSTRILFVEGGGEDSTRPRQSMQSMPISTRGDSVRLLHPCTDEIGVLRAIADRVRDSDSIGSVPRHAFHLSVLYYHIWTPNLDSTF